MLAFCHSLCLRQRRKRELALSKQKPGPMGAPRICHRRRRSTGRPWKRASNLQQRCWCREAPWTSMLGYAWRVRHLLASQSLEWSQRQVQFYLHSSKVRSQLGSYRNQRSCTSSQGSVCPARKYQCNLKKMTSTKRYSSPPCRRCTWESCHQPLSRSRQGWHQTSCHRARGWKWAR